MDKYDEQLVELGLKLKKINEAELSDVEKQKMKKSIQEEMDKIRKQKQDEEHQKYVDSAISDNKIVNNKKNDLERIKGKYSEVSNKYNEIKKKADIPDGKWHNKFIFHLKSGLKSLFATGLTGATIWALVATILTTTNPIALVLVGSIAALSTYSCISFSILPKIKKILARGKLKKIKVEKEYLENLVNTKEKELEKTIEHEKSQTKEKNIDNIKNDSEIKKKKTNEETIEELKKAKEQLYKPMSDDEIEKSRRNLGM